MSFNHGGYEPVRSQTLPNGNYEFIIRAAEEKEGTYGNYIEVVLQARGKKGWVPNKIIFNEAPVIGTVKPNGKVVTDEDLKRWNRDFTTFFDAFGITPGNFVTQTWVNKIGWAKVAEQYDPNEADKKSKKYKGIFPFVPEAEEPAAPAEKAPETVNKVAEAVQGTVYPEPVQTMPPNNTIPF